MNRSSERPTDEKLEEIVNTYGTPLLRLCLMMLGSNMDGTLSQAELIQMALELYQ